MNTVNMELTTTQQATLTFIKDELIPALRSGEYAKGEKTLVSGAGTTTPQYCCLGVWCSIEAQRGNLYTDNDGTFGSYDLNYYDDNDDRSSTYLPQLFAASRGLHAELAIRNEFQTSLHNHLKNTYVADDYESRIPPVNIAGINDQSATFAPVITALEWLIERPEAIRWRASAFNEVVPTNS